MTTDLQAHIQKLAVVDTHEHLRSEHLWLSDPSLDVLGCLFNHYAVHDLVSAGADQKVVDRLLDGRDPDIEGRWAGIAKYWFLIQHTGYGQAVQLTARHALGMPRIDAPSLRAAVPLVQQFRKPGERLTMLRDHAGLDHVQIDHFQRTCPPDPAGPDFFLYDLNWSAMSQGRLQTEILHKETGVTISDLSTLEQAIDRIFERWGACAIAVKSQHAYARTLTWQLRSDADAGVALKQILANPELEDPAARLCLGDWCLARGIEHAITCNLPIKLHTGYYAGNAHMPLDGTRTAHLSALLSAYPKARFVLMHAGYPYTEEWLAMIKHYPNAWGDLCWAWGIDPAGIARIIRQFIRTAPANKLLGFGGDSLWPTASLGYCIQARQWMIQTLQQEIDDRTLTESQAIELSSRFLRNNAMECFDVAGRRNRLRKQISVAS